MYNMVMSLPEHRGRRGPPVGAAMVSIVLALACMEPAAAAPVEDGQSSAAHHVYVPISLRFDASATGDAPCIERHEQDNDDDGTIDRLWVKPYWSSEMYDTSVYVRDNDTDDSVLTDYIRARFDPWRMVGTYTRDQLADGIPDYKMTYQHDVTGRRLNERHDAV